MGSPQPGAQPSGRHGGVLRIPLQIGAQAMRQIAAASFFLPFGFLFVVATGVGAWKGVPWSQLSFVALLAITPLGIGAGYVMRAVRSRASDLLVGPDGVRVDGGPAHGTRIPWQEIDPSTTAVVEASKGATHWRDLWLGTRDGKRVRLGTCWLSDPGYGDDSTALDAVAVAVRAVSERRPAATTTRPPSLVTCASCLAAVAPEDADAVPCRFCGARVPMPNALRAKVRAAQQIGAEARARDARVASLMADLPTARRSNAWIASSAVALMPLTAFAFFFGSWICNIVEMFFRTRVADRKCLRALALGFRPLPAAAAGGAPLCRCCGGPLPPAMADQVVERCAYCGAANVLLGVDLDVDLASARAAESSLDSAFAAHEKARAARRRATVHLVALVAVGAALTVCACRLAKP